MHFYPNECYGLWEFFYQIQQSGGGDILLTPLKELRITRNQNQ